MGVAVKKPRRSISARTLHRALGLILGVFALYLGVTGTVIQVIDLVTVLSDASPENLNQMAIHEGINGPENFAVIGPGDYRAAALPAGFGLDRAVSRILASARKLSPADPFSFIDLRMLGNKPVGQVMAGNRLLRIDAISGLPLPARPLTSPANPEAPKASRLVVRGWHRLEAFGDLILILNAAFGIALCVATVAGLVLYVKMARQLWRANRRVVFWAAGGWLRKTHRAVALISSAFVLMVAITGTLLSIDDFSLGLYVATHHHFPSGMVIDVSSPLSDKDAHDMLRGALAGYSATQNNRPIKAVRLREFAHMPQGVVIAGGAQPEQLVFNTATRLAVSQSEAGYPDTVFPLGWQLHETVKRIHRGDYFGLMGRAIDLLSGLSLIFLSATGLTMYYELWNRRRRAGRNALFWN